MSDTLTVEDLETMARSVPDPSKPFWFKCASCGLPVGPKPRHWYAGLPYCSVPHQLEGKERTDRMMEEMQEKRDRR